MIAIGDDKQTIHLTRGDTPQSNFNKIAFKFPIYNLDEEKEEDYVFQPEDKISFIIVEKKGYTKRELLRKEYKIKDIGYTDPTTCPELVLTEEDTKVFPVSNKKQTFWYDLILNDTTTMLGYDQDGAKKIIVYPEVDER